MPESYWDKEKGEVKGADLRKNLDDLSAFKAEQDIRMAAVPASATDYQVRLPDKFEMPQGVTFEFNKDDPALAAAREWAHAKKMPQGDFSELLGMYAAQRIAEVQQINSARTAEVGKLGTTGPQRIEAIKQWQTAKFGAEKAEALAMTMVTAKQAEAWEDVIRLFSTQGGGSFTQRGRETEQADSRPSNWDQMTAIDRRTYQLTRGAPQRAAGGQR